VALAGRQALIEGEECPDSRNGKLDFRNPKNGVGSDE
jgi:hypothetical protein